jgi:hypothetical protein
MVFKTAAVTKARPGVVLRSGVILAFKTAGAQRRLHNGIIATSPMAFKTAAVTNARPGVVLRSGDILAFKTAGYQRRLQNGSHLGPV